MTLIETYYLIDFENVHSDGLSGCEELCKKDHIIIFFTTNARMIDMTAISNLKGTELLIKEVPSGNQSVDMHICSYLGYLAGTKGAECKVYIISKDADFDKVIPFWKNEIGLSISRKQQIKATATSVMPLQKQSIAGQEQKKTNEKTEKNVEIQKLLSKGKQSNEVISFVASTVVKNFGKKNGKQQIYRSIISKYGQKKGLEVYSAIKKHI